MSKEFKKFLSLWKPIDGFILFFSICSIIFLNYFPLLYAYLSTPRGAVFSGEASFFEPVDTNLYVSAIHFGQWGGILLPNLYTSTPNTPVLIYPFLTMLGFIFKSVNSFLLFHLAGVISAIFLIIGLVFVIYKLGFSIKMSLFSTVVICLGGGFGFIDFPTVTPADMTYIHPTFFLTLQKPHESIAVFLFIFALSYLYFFILSKKKLNIKLILPILIPLVICTFIYPFFAISFFLISGSFLILRKKMRISKRDISLFLILLISSGLTAGIIFLQFLINPSFLGISAHIGVSILSEFLGFGILIPIFIFQLFWLPKSSLKTFLSILFVIIFALAILPFGPGAVFFRGSFFPVVLLSVLVLEKLWGKVNTVLRNVLIICFFMVLVATSLRIFYMRMTYDYAANPYIYIPAQQYGIFSFLNKHTAPSSTVLALYLTANEIPAITHNAVYIGHGLQTPNALQRIAEVQSFYKGEYSFADAKEFLLKNNISYVVWGIEEKTYYLTHANNENHLKEIFSHLSMVYLNNGIALFFVDRERLRNPS